MITCRFSSCLGLCAWVLLALTLAACGLFSSDDPADDDGGDPTTVRAACHEIPGLDEIHWSPYAPDVGVAIGSQHTGMYLTSDGGRSFQRSAYNWSDEFPDYHSGFSPTSVVFLDADHWIVVGAITRFINARNEIASRVIATSDGGQSFTPIFEGSDDTRFLEYPNEPDIRPFDRPAEAVFRLDEQRVAALTRGLLLGSVDNGATWHAHDIFGTWNPDPATFGFPSDEIATWFSLDADGVGLVFVGGWVFATRDRGLTFERVVEEGVADAALDPQGRLVTIERVATSFFFHLYDHVDGRWQEVANNFHDVDAGLNANEILWFLPDGSFVATVHEPANIPEPFLTLVRRDGDRLVRHPIEVDAGDGIEIGDVLGQSRVAGRHRALIEGGADTPSFRRRMLCELGEDVTPVALPLAGVPADLAPGEIARYARRMHVTHAFDRMTFDASGRVYVASSRALWAGPESAPPLFQGSRTAPQDWHPPNHDNVAFPETGGLTVAPSGALVLALNFIGTERQLLFIEPATGELLSWQTFLPFDDELYVRDLFAVGGLVFGATASGTADIGATADVGGDGRFHGMPGRGVARSDGAYTYLHLAAPGPDGHAIGRLSMFEGRLPDEGFTCASCTHFPGMVQALVADDDGIIYVLDRRQAAVFRRPFDDEGADWQLLASGFHNPADIALLTRDGVELVAVLDGDVFVFRPDPAAPATRGVDQRPGDGEIGGGGPRPIEADGGACSAESGPCIEPPTYSNPGLEELDGVVLLEPVNGGSFCFDGVGLGAEEGTVWFNDSPVTTFTVWGDRQVCGAIAPEGIVDGLVWIETAGGLTSNTLPFIAPAANVRFEVPDPPVETGDVIRIVGDNLGLRGHAVTDGLLLPATPEGIDVIIDAGFRGTLAFSKRASFELWTEQVPVLPSALVGAVAGPSERGGISGHVGTGAAWTLDGAPIDPPDADGDWISALSVGDHTVTASVLGEEVSVDVARVTYDTHTHGRLYPDGIALPPHRQASARHEGQTYTLVRTGSWQRPGGPGAEEVPGIPTVEAAVSIPKGGGVQHIAGRAFVEPSGARTPDEDYDTDEDMPRLVATGGALFRVARARDVTIEPDTRGNPTVTLSRTVTPLTAVVASYPASGAADGTPHSLEAEPLATVVAPNDAADGRVAGAGGADGQLWVALSGDDETWVVRGAVDDPEGWAPAGVLTGDWDAHPVGDGVLFLQTGQFDAPVALSWGGFDANGTLTTEDISAAVDGVPIRRVMAWRAEGDGGALFALRLEGGDEVVATLAPGATAPTQLETIPSDLPGVGITRDHGVGYERFGVADVIRYEGDVIVALAVAEGESEPGLWLARLADGEAEITRELASIATDTSRCLGPYPIELGACGVAGAIETNTEGCTYFACPQRVRLWLPQHGGGVEQARLAVDDEGLEVTYAVRFPAGWSRHTLDRGRIRTAVFTEPPRFE